MNQRQAGPFLYLSHWAAGLLRWCAHTCTGNVLASRSRLRHLRPPSQIGLTVVPVAIGCIAMAGYLVSFENNCCTKKGDNHIGSIPASLNAKGSRQSLGHTSLDTAQPEVLLRTMWQPEVKKQCRQISFYSQELRCLLLL